MRKLLSLVLATALLPGIAGAQTVTPISVVVEIPTPAGAPRARIEQGIRDSVPQYRKVPGLLRKYFTIGDGTFGGVYLFESREAAQAWFGPAWRARVQATYGAPAKVTYFDVPVVLDNAAVPAGALAQ